HTCLVDRQGRTAIRIGTMEQCRHVQQTIRIQKLLNYLQNIIEISDGFRRIFCECEIECDDELDDITRTEKVLLSEKMLWKSARSALHEIFINSFFMDSEWKKTFGILYMKAKYLISSHNAFETIVDSFLEYCQSKLDHSKLLFSRATNASIQHQFRRAQSILYDLKYLLGVAPQEYTTELRENFLNGFRAFLQLLTYMHGNRFFFSSIQNFLFVEFT
ncbi:unnamed protein product, partial [Rotaria sordida]